MDTNHGRVHAVLSNQSSCQKCLRREHLSSESVLSQQSTDEPDLAASDTFINLGYRPIDWFMAGESNRASLYPLAVQESIAILERISGKRIRYQEGEILFGHLANLLSMRVARALAQFALMSASELCDVRIEFPSSPPISSLDAMNLIASPSFGALVELLLASQRGMRVKSSFFEAAPAADAVRGSTTLYTRIHNLLAAPLRPKGLKAKVLIVSPYIGKFRELVLKIGVRASPIFFELRPGWAQPNHFGIAKRRHSISEGTLSKPGDRALLRALLLECLPSALLEHFDATYQISHKLGFPSRPVNIFTSNAFDTDDVFKTYLASVRPDVSYLVGQHGNNYGVARFTIEAPEVRTSDAFLSWGWQGANVLPVGQLKPSVRPVKSPYLGVVLVLRDRLRTFTAQDADFTFQIYLKAVFSLADMLSKRGIGVTIRSHPSDFDFVFRRFIDASLGITVTLQPVGQPLRQALLRRLVPVFCYDSTGVLEAASAGGEFFIFAPDGLKHVEDKYRSNYRFLEIGGLLAEDPALATEAIMKWLRAQDRSSYHLAIKRFADGIVKRPPALLVDLIGLLDPRKPSSFSKAEN